MSVSNAKFALQSLKELNQGHFRLIPVMNVTNLSIKCGFSQDFPTRFSTDYCLICCSVKER